jgi:uncharacterized protein
VLRKKEIDMKTYRTNPYNVLIPVEERGEYLLFNTLSGGIEILSDEIGGRLAELSSLKSFDELQCDGLDYLIQNEYIINGDLDLIQVMDDAVVKRQGDPTQAIHLTIGTTISCNMGCSYCFEFVKPNLTLKDKNVKEHIVKYIEQVITHPRNNIKVLGVVWYGGEPLLNVKAIDELSAGFLELVEKYNLKYESSIITNGIYLTTENVERLIRNRVMLAQVTIDGSQETHDIKRPLKQTRAENYTRIMRNISQIPVSDFQVQVRINLDKEVAATVEKFLDDLESYDIWPRLYKQVNFSPAWLRTYEEIEISEQERSKRMDVVEYFDFKFNFRLQILRRFNSYAEATNRKNARLTWDLPKFQETCATWASPTGLVIDPEGNIHKCWETIHDDKQGTQATVFDKYNPDEFKPYTSFNRYTQNPVCRNCKYLPVCDTISCSFEFKKNTVPSCTMWKYRAEAFIKEQYLRMKEQPETIAEPAAVDAINKGHSNK